MIKINLPKLCSCAKHKKSWNKDYRFETLEEAIKKAKRMCKKANDEFCDKHRFDYEIKENKVNIIIKPHK